VAHPRPGRGVLEKFEIKDDMNFLQKTIPSCTPANLAVRWPAVRPASET